MKSELTEEMKDLMVLHNYASRTTLLTVNTPKAEESVESERVLLSCSIQDVSLTICDASDVYTRADYINTYKYKAIHDFTMTVRSILFLRLIDSSLWRFLDYRRTK